MQPIRFALAMPPSHIPWADYLAAVQAADETDFEAFWTFDHLMPIFGDMDGSNFECYTTLAGLAAATKRIRLGALVSGVTYRNPGIQLKEATQIDVISGGRFIFGIGAGWAEREFKAFDIPFAAPKDRIGMLRETLDVAKLLWSGDPRKKVSYVGKYVKVTDAFLNPQPVQSPRPPILIGGGGEQLTLRVVARHADIWHGGGDHETLRRKIGLIDDYARGYGRDPQEIARSTSVSLWVGDAIPDTAVAAIASLRGQTAEQVRGGMVVGSPEAIEAKIRGLVEVGITYFIVSGGSPTLTDNWRRISEEVIPRFANG